jgi:putative ABC transport system permease protein
MLHELRLSWRSLLRPENHGFTLATTLTLALAMTAVTTIVSLAYGVLWSPLPFRDAGRVVRIDEAHAARGLVEYAVSQPNFTSWREKSSAFAGMAAIREGNANLGAGGGQPAQRLAAYSITPDLWTVLGTPLLSGNGLTAQGAAADEVIISERLWRQRYRASPDALGQTLSVDGVTRSIVGVAPQDMGFAAHVDLWLPIVRDESSDRRGDRRLIVVGRLKDSVSLRAAEDELNAIAATLERQYPESNAGWSVHLRQVRDWIVTAEARQRLLLLMAAVTLLMLVAFTNVANLQIARATARLHELGVRQALGASMGRLVTMLTIENLSLVLAGAAAGIVASYLLLQAVAALLPASMPRQGEIGFDFWRVALVMLAAGIGAMLFGTAATLIARRSSAQQALAPSVRGSLGAGATPLRDALVVVQFTLATTLVVVSAMLSQQYLALRGAEPGFDADGVVVARISLPSPSSEDEHQRSLALYDNLMQGIAALPGVQSVGLSSEIPLGEANTSMEVWGPQTAADSHEPGVQASWRIVSADYLATLRVPLLRGRFFAQHDESAGSTLISAELAGRLFAPGADPLGQSIFLGNGQRRTIVGVVGDVRQTSLGAPAAPAMYFSTNWYLWPTMSFAARTAGDAAALVHPMRVLARRIAPDHPLFDIQPLSAVLDASVAEQKLQLYVIAVFALASLLLAAVGIVGVMNYLVVRRTPELALRMALGASHGGAIRRVLVRGVVLCGVGVLLGLGMAMVARHWLPQTADAGASLAWIIPVLALLLTLVGALASWWPLRRIAQISPGQLLRGDGA